MGGILNLPVRADGLGGVGGSGQRICDVECRFGGVVQQPGLGVAGVDVPFNPDDGSDMGVPVGVGQLVCGIKDGDGAAFVAVAALVVAAGRPERRRDCSDFLDPLVQGRLVVLDLDD